ncbi:MAG TPA: histidine kinase [Thermoanaerobaculia bacterium]|nr:histidine kinase [Thermoanaerobaculia bacterium]
MQTYEIVNKYLDAAGLPHLIADQNFRDLTSEAVSRLRALADADSVPSNDAEHHDLYRYRVPLPTQGVGCSLLADEPYDLRLILGGQRADTTDSLLRLGILVNTVYEETGCGWLGVYQARVGTNERVLVKLSYRGKPSRAEFPLTKEFAADSNNSTVGLSGNARVIDDVECYVQEGGAYYTCDPNVQAEACLPLFDIAGNIAGIVDAEDPRKGYFGGVDLAPFVALCIVAPSYLPK